MKYIENAKCVTSIFPQDLNGTTPVNGTGVDVGGCAFVRARVVVGAITNAATELIVQESDDNSIWSSTAVATFTNPGSGSDNTERIAFIPCQGVRKKYLRIRVTGGASATLIWGGFDLIPIDASPNTATEYGVAEVVYA